VDAGFGSLEARIHSDKFENVFMMKLTPRRNFLSSALYRLVNKQTLFKHRCIPQSSVPSPLDLAQGYA
jgi:hypothetical protein